MSKSSKKSKKNRKYWGTEESYYPFKISVAELGDQDLEISKDLTPTQRLEWLLMMQRLLIEQFQKKK